MIQPSGIFPRVAILGVGLLGASLGLALKKHKLAAHITGAGRANSPSLDIALRLGAIDAATTDAADAVRAADLVVLCTPVRQFPQNFRDIAGALKPGALVTDVGSTKTQVLQWAQEFLPAHIAFVGSHPMAGSEKNGPAAARDNLYENAVCLVIHAPHAERIAALWKSLGMKVLLTDAATHDRWVAAISHLPHALAFSLMNVTAQDPAALQAIAGAFIDTTRIASSDPQMWVDILLTNRPAIIAAIGEFQTELAALKQAIVDQDESAIRRRLDSARALRENLLDPRKMKEGT